jgi:hypothetical protein
VIVRAERGRVRLILQTDHAMLSGELATAWGGERFSQPAPMAPVRMAAEIHDDGWAEWEREPKVMPENGRPCDFLSLPPDEHIAIYERGIRQASEQHPYAGLLVSLHGSGLYLRRHGYMPDLTFKEHDPGYLAVIEGFLKRQKAFQEELKGQIHPDEQALWTHYRWLQAWDVLSLYLCRNDPADEQPHSLGKMPLRPGGPEETLVLQGAGRGVCTVTPWPFAAERLDLMVPVRYLPDVAYADDAQFQEDFAAAPTVPLALALVSEV